MVASDTFTGVAARAPLSGRVTEVGSLTWNSNNMVGGTGYHVTGVTGTNPTATVSYVPTGGETAIAEADVNPNGSNWVAVGFTNHAGWGWWADGQVWAMIKSNGIIHSLCERREQPPDGE